MTRSAALVLRAAGPLLWIAAASLEGGTLGGRLLDAEGRPVEGARVVAVRFEAEEERLLSETEGRPPESLAETRTDAAGAYRITLDKPGVSVVMRFQSPGLPEARLTEPCDSGDTTTLDDLQLPAASKHAGRVADEKGAPVAGARVASIWNDEDSGAVFLAETRTAADGSWSLASAPDGARAVTVRADGFVPFSRFALRRNFAETVILRRGGELRGAVLDPAGKPVAGAIVAASDVAARTDAAGAFRLKGVAAGMQAVATEWKEEFAARREVRVAAGGSAEANLKLARAAAISGSVVDETTRRPVPGAWIAVHEAAGFSTSTASRRLRSDARGHFRAGGLVPGRYRVDAGSRGYLPSSIPGATAAVPSGPALAVALRREASIAGRVTDEEGKPVAGARVSIPQEMGPRRLLRPGRSSLRRAETKSGPDGTFSLRRLAPATLTIEASKPGYAATRKTGIRIKMGESVRGVALLLRRGLSAGGTVVDVEGKAIAGAEVRATKAERERRNFAFFRAVGGGEDRPDAVSGGDGTFELNGLEAARYQVVAAKKGLVQKAPATLDAAEGAENRVAPIVLETAVAVAGVVRNTRGEPVPGARVLVAGEGGRPLDASTDPAGRFRIAGLVEGRAVLLFASADGYAPRQSNTTPPAENLAITLDTSAVVRGRVEDAGTNAPVADFSVSRNESMSQTGGMILRLATGGDELSFHAEDGNFELPDVPPGRWTIRAEAPGYRAAEVAGIEVGPGEVKEGVVLSLKRGGSIAGRVVDAARGAPVPNASVTWRASGSGGGGGGFRLGAQPQQDTATDADGRFSFDALPEGKIRLEASHPDYTDASIEVDPDRQPTAEIALGSGGSISGVVVGSDGRSPAAGARVALDTQGEAGGPFGSAESATTDGAGAFLFDHLRAGRYELVAQGNTGSAPPREVVLTDGQRADGIVLQTASGALLRGTVTGLPASQLAGVRVQASSTSYSDSASTDANGQFTLRDVPAGVVRLSASTSLMQGRTAQTTVEVPDGAAEFPVEIAFQGSSRLSGRVTRGGRGLSGVFVFAAPDPPTGASRASTQTGGDGSYALEGLSDGAYQVSVSGAGASYRKEFEVSGDTSGDIELPATMLSGLVTDGKTGQPLESADVQAETGQETQSFAVKRASTDSNGAYSIENVDPGSYRVTARKTGYQLKTQTVEVGSDPASLDFALAGGAGLSIRVIDGLTGIPLSGVQVLAFAADGTVAFQGRVSLEADGTGEVPSLADGTYALYIFSDGYAPRALPGVTAPSPPISVSMTPGGRVEVRPEIAVTGRLVDSAGSPVLLAPWRLDGSVTATPPVTVWEHLPPGPYRLTFGGADGEKTASFDVTEGQTTRVDLR